MRLKITLAFLAQSCALLAQHPELGPPPIATGVFPRTASQPQPATPGAVTWYDTTSRSNIRNLYNTIFVPARTVPLGWSGNVATGVAGDTAQAYKDAVAARINWIRALVGVPAAITLNSTYNAGDQQAAMMMSANQQLSHNPPATWINYNAQGANAAGMSNLCIGFNYTEQATDPGCIELYMQDFGSGNTVAGHRRWLIYPQTKQYGTGDVPFTQSSGLPSANAVWVFDGNFGTVRPATRDTFVAWPPPGYVPYQFEPTRYSFSYPDADFSRAIVTMTRNGANVPVSLETPANGYGENALIWYPTGADNSAPPNPVAPATDTSVAITLTNVMINGSSRSFSYVTTLFDPSTAGAGAVPSVSSVSPQSGNASAQTFTFTFNDTAGAANFDVVNVLMNPFLDGRFGCYIAYSNPSKVLYLVNDSGTALSTGLTLNTTGSVNNSYCTINSAGSSAVTSGNSLTLTLAMTFTTAFAGDKVIYAAARDLTGGNSGWTAGGVWRIPGSGAAALTVASLSPGSGAGNASSFTITFRDPVSGANITNAQVLINNALDGNNACYLGYVRAGNQLYLVNDQSPGLQPPVTPNTGTGSAQNSQCTLNGAGTTSAVNGTDLLLTINLSFKPAFAGAKIVYAAAQSSGGTNSGWQARGVWTSQ